LFLAEQVDLSKDLGDWLKMTNDEKHFIFAYSHIVCVCGPSGPLGKASICPEGVEELI